MKLGRVRVDGRECGCGGGMGKRRKRKIKNGTRTHINRAHEEAKWGGEMIESGEGGGVGGGSSVVHFC